MDHDWMPPFRKRSKLRAPALTLPEAMRRWIRGSDHVGLRSEIIQGEMRFGFRYLEPKEIRVGFHFDRGSGRLVQKVRSDKDLAALRTGCRTTDWVLSFKVQCSNLLRPRPSFSLVSSRSLQCAPPHLLVHPEGRLGSSRRHREAGATRTCRRSKPWRQ